MNKLIAFLIATVLALITAQAALAFSFTYTGWGPMNAPLEGTHMISYGDRDMRIGAYGSDTRMTIYGSGRGTGDLGVGVSLARTPTTTWERGQDGWDYRTQTGYSDWNVQSATAQCASCGWGFTTQRSPMGTYSGVGYVDTYGYRGAPSTYAPTYRPVRGSFGRDAYLNAYGGYNWQYANLPQQRTIISTLSTARAGYVVP